MRDFWVEVVPDLPQNSAALPSKPWCGCTEAFPTCGQFGPRTTDSSRWQSQPVSPPRGPQVWWSARPP